MHLGKYLHFKGKEYEVIGIAHDCETLEELVVYRALYDSEEFGKNALWVRKKEDFLANVEREGEIVTRFTYMGSEE